ncbi:MAG: GAF domain-containing protein [Ardenticatenaceae bacterium]|nr:GAF domain-containing protein [Ardenticatenaceae bacterium]
MIETLPTSLFILGTILVAALIVLCGFLLLQGQRNREQGQREQQQLAALGRMGQVVVGSLSLERVLKKILDQVPLLVGAEGVAILLHEDKELVFVAISGAAATGLQGYRMPYDAGVAGQVFQTKEPQLAAGQTGRQLIYQGAERISGYTTQALLAVPLLLGETALGVLEAVHSAPEGFSLADLQVLADAANWAAIAIQNARLYEQMQAELAERRRVEAALRDSEKRYRSLAEVSPVGIFRLDLEGRCLYANGRFLEMTAHAEPVIGQPWLGLLDLLDREGVQHEWETAVDHDSNLHLPAPFQLEFEVSSRDGEKWLLVTIAPEYGEREHHVGYVGTMADMTQQKQAESVLRYAAKMESLDLFAGSIAHDYNNLLMAMMGQAAIAQYQLESDNPANIYINKLNSVAEKAAALTTQVMTYSGGAYFLGEPLLLNEVIEAEETLLAELVPKHITLKLELGEGLRPVESEPQQIKQLLVYLLLNAIDAVTEQDDPQITIRTDSVLVEQRDEHLWQYTGTPLEPGIYCVLEVQDNGHGIEPKNLPKVFDPFFTTKQFGQGLGLSTVLGIVRGHNGGIFIRNFPGRGCVFEVYFPAMVDTLVPLG